MTDSQHVSRRALLKTGAAAAVAVYSGAVSSPVSSLWGAEAEPGPYGSFKMGIQSYTLRDFKVDEALEISKKLGLHYWESFPGHIKAASVPSYIAEQKAMLAGSGVKLVAFGVVDFNDNESKAREIFDFAKAIGIESISA